MDSASPENSEARRRRRSDGPETPKAPPKRIRRESEGSGSSSATSDAGGEDVVSGGEDVVAGGEEVVTGGEEVVSGGEDVVAGGEEVVAGGEEVVTGGQEVVAGGEVVPGGEEVVAGGKKVVAVGILATGVEDEESGRGSVGSVSVIGGRKRMEDAVTVAPDWTIAGPGCSPESYGFFAVYDGHGGPLVAEECRDRLHLVLAEEVARARQREAEGELWGEEQVWRRAMEEAFARMEVEVAPKAAEGEDGMVGSTAVVAVVGPRRIVVANCGDSRAVLSRGGVAIPLSLDHKPDRPDERVRIEAAGGSIIELGCKRVLGVLATSRAIGDYFLKPFVSSEPEVTLTDRTEQDEFLVLASDGLWDVVSSESACRVIRRILSGQAANEFPNAVSGVTAAEAASVLVEVALSRGSSDNISVVVVELKNLRSGGRV